MRLCVCVYIINVFFREPLFLLNKKLRSIIRHVVKSHVFFWLMILAVSINFIVLCADFYPAPEKWLLALCK